MDALWKWDATALAAGIRAGEICARDAVTACIERMHEVNPRLNAVTCDLSEAALAAATRADSAPRSARQRGALHGVPVTVKESTDQEGCATVNGAAANLGLLAHTDNPVIANLRNAGAIPIGRTNTPAFSFRLDTDNTVRGRTFNPWSPRHTPGGSSGGAAAALAAGIGPLAHGNDSAGSLRFPAYCTGVAALRPSFGRVPAHNATSTAERPISAQLVSVQGPMARTVRDLRLGLACMAVADARDPWWVPAPLAGEPIAAPVRVAIVDDAAQLAGAVPCAGVARALQHAQAALADAGYAIVPTATPGLTRPFELWLEMFVPELRRFMQADWERDGDDGLRTALRLLLAAVPPSDAEAHLRALAERTRHVRDWQLFLEHTPLVVTPICTELPYEIGFDVHSAERTMAMWRQLAPMTAVATLGLPAVAVPTGMADGLPVGVQIVGPRFREDLVLAAAEAIESRSPRLVPIDPVPKETR